MSLHFTKQNMAMLSRGARELCKRIPRLESSLAASSAGYHKNVILLFLSAYFHCKKRDSVPEILLREVITP